MSKQLLIEHMPLQLRLEESSDGSGKIIARGQFARSDQPTQNKRLYREHLWKREIGRLNEAIENRRCFGELDHPQDGRTKLQRVSHLITGLRIEGNEVVGEAEVVDTPNGRIMKALVKAGAQVGVSSRGYGSVKSLPDGVQEVQEDFRLDTFDFVADPATSTAYPGIFTEERQHIQEAMEEFTVDTLRVYYPGLMESFKRDVLQEHANGQIDVARAITEAEHRAEQRLKTEFARTLRRDMEVLYEEARKDALSELLSDPNVAESKAICERIYGMVRSFGPSEAEVEESSKQEISGLREKVADKELELQKLTREVEEAKKLAKLAGYSLHLERRVSGYDAKKTVIELVGDVLQYENKEALDKRIDTVVEELKSKGVLGDVEQTSEGVAKKDAEIEELRTLVTQKDEQLKEERSKLRDAQRQARRAVELSEAMQVELHVERRISESNPHAPKLRVLCEGATSVEQVDKKLDSYDPPKGRRIDEDEHDRIRSRVSAQKPNPGKERSLVEDTFGGKNPGDQSGNGGSSLLDPFGLTEDHFDRLAGIKPS